MLCGRGAARARARGSARAAALQPRALAVEQSLLASIPCRLHLGSLITHPRALHRAPRRGGTRAHSTRAGDGFGGRPRGGGVAGEQVRRARGGRKRRAARKRGAGAPRGSAAAGAVGRRGRVSGGVGSRTCVARLAACAAKARARARARRGLYVEASCRPDSHRGDPSRLARRPLRGCVGGRRGLCACARAHCADTRAKGARSRASRRMWSGEGASCCARRARKRKQPLGPAASAARCGALQTPRWDFVA